MLTVLQPTFVVNSVTAYFRYVNSFTAFCFIKLVMLITVLQPTSVMLTVLQPTSVMLTVLLPTSVMLITALQPTSVMLTEHCCTMFTMLQCYYVGLTPATMPQGGKTHVLSNLLNVSRSEATTSRQTSGASGSQPSSWPQAVLLTISIHQWRSGEPLAHFCSLYLSNPQPSLLSSMPFFLLLLA